ncbi:MAG: LysR family transcriptional regulator [Alphaproteobacteria bacterium]|nr:LysR family transcriptional regulator [Alphaproteobacteria bacterium]
MDRDDVRVFLAVAGHGSLRAAGRALGLSQPTIGRRLAAFEATFGGPSLFDRLPEGLRLTALRPAAQQLESAALALERHRAAGPSLLSGTVRLGRGVGRELRPGSGRPVGGPDRRDYPRTRRVAGDRQSRAPRRISRRVTIRRRAALYGSKPGAFACAVCRRRGSENRAWATYPEEQAHYPTAGWVQERLRETGDGVALRASGMPMQFAAIRAGAAEGTALFAADADPMLERVTGPVPDIAAEYWVIVHRDLRRALCVRAVIEWIRRLFIERRDVLAGTAVRQSTTLAAE